MFWFQFADGFIVIFFAPATPSPFKLNGLMDRMCKGFMNTFAQKSSFFFSQQKHDLYISPQACLPISKVPRVHQVEMMKAGVGELGVVLVVPVDKRGEEVEEVGEDGEGGDEEGEHGQRLQLVWKSRDRQPAE